jgi:hypothetical protein
VSPGDREKTETESALRSLWELLDAPRHRRFALVLGDFGAGKTFLLHELARRMARDKHPLVPVLLEMNQLQKQQRLDVLVAQHFAFADHMASSRGTPRTRGWRSSAGWPGMRGAPWPRPVQVAGRALRR